MTANSAQQSAALRNGAAPTAAEDPNETNYGWAMFVTFLTAVLAISFAVCALAMVRSWWMLAVVFATDLTVTGLVFRVVVRALGFGADPQAEGAATKATVPAATPKVGSSLRRAAVPLHH